MLVCLSDSMQALGLPQTVHVTRAKTPSLYALPRPKYHRCYQVRRFLTTTCFIPMQSDDSRPLERTFCPRMSIHDKQNLAPFVLKRGERTGLVAWGTYLHLRNPTTGVQEFQRVTENLATYTGIWGGGGNIQLDARNLPRYRNTMKPSERLFIPSHRNGAL